jgi:hypothetical protein
LVLRQFWFRLWCFSALIHNGQPVMIRTIFFGLSWKMIFSFLPPNVRPSN